MATPEVRCKAQKAVQATFRCTAARTRLNPPPNRRLGA